MMKKLLVCFIFLCCTKMIIAQTNMSIKDTSDVIPKRIEVEAEFLGGPGSWASFLRKNLKAKVPSKKGAPEGVYNVIIRFAIQKDGTLGDFAAETICGYGMEEEVMRVIKKSPKWVAATQDGKEIKAYRRQPITFTVGKK